MSTVLDILLGSTFIAFVWEPAILGIYFLLKGFSKFGKIHVIRFKKINGIRVGMRSAWPKVGSEAVSPAKGETHTIETDSFAFLERNGLATNPVLFVDVDSTRPLMPVFKDPGIGEFAQMTRDTPEYIEGITRIHELTMKGKKRTKEESDELQRLDPQGELALVAIPHNPEGVGKEFSLNPHTQDTDDLYRRKTVRQLVAAGAMGNASLLLLILAIAVGVGIGYAINGLVNPQHLIYACPPQDSCTAPIVTTATGQTQTLTASP